MHDLYGKWDLEYGPDRRPKSDVVMRTIARACRWKQLPKCKWIGWDFEPLTEWRYTRPTLEEVKAKTEQPVWPLADIPARQCGQTIVPGFWV